MKKVLRTIKNSLAFLCEPEIYRTRWWHFIVTLLASILGNLIANTLLYYYG